LSPPARELDTSWHALQEGPRCRGRLGSRADPALASPAHPFRADTDDSASDDGEPEIESEEEDDGVIRHASSRAAGSANSYPLEGQFKDEKDKARYVSLRVGAGGFSVD